MPDDLTPAEALARIHDRTQQNAYAKDREIADAIDAKRRELRNAAGGLLEGDRVFDRVSGTHAIVFATYAEAAGRPKSFRILLEDGRAFMRTVNDLVPVPQRPAPGGAGKP